MKLKPCPFCGKEPSVFRYNGGEMRIECVDPDCQASVRIEAANEQRAVNKWNTRAGEPGRFAHWDINCDGYYPFCSHCGEATQQMALIDDIPTVAEAANTKAAAIMQHYGAEHQKDILIEECAELIQAVEKSRRGVLAEDKPAYTEDMIEEIADVQIMIWQFRSLLNGFWDECFENEIMAKLRRQFDRIENEKEDT